VFFYGLLSPNDLAKYLRFNITMDPNNDLPTMATCTTCRFKEDLSNYWTAVMYFKHPNGSYLRVWFIFPVELRDYCYSHYSSIGPSNSQPIRRSPERWNDCVLHSTLKWREGYFLQEGTRFSTNPEFLSWPLGIPYDRWRCHGT